MNADPGHLPVMNQARARTVPGTNNGSYAPVRRNETCVDLHTGRLHECTGADLPRLAFTHGCSFDISKVAPVRNGNFYKPSGGAWLSPYADDGRTEWARFGDVADYAPAKRSTTVTDVALVPNARVLVIDSRDDFINVVEAHSYVYENELNRHLEEDKRLLDFESIARDYDAIWVTQRGVNTNQLIPAHGQPTLGPWDIPSVLVLNRDAVA